MHRTGEEAAPGVHRISCYASQWSPLAQNGANETLRVTCFHGLICAGIRTNHLCYRFKRSGRDFAGMMPPSDPQYGLEVSRADLAQTLKIVARATRKYRGNARLSFEDGCLSIAAVDTIADAPASGIWPLPIFVGASWIRALAKSMPAGDPVILRVDQGRLHANRYSEPCSWTSTECSPDSWSPEDEEELLIQEAARILKPLRIERPAVEGLVSEALARGTSSWSRGIVAWSGEEKKMRTIVENAWMRLAPFGVGMSDIHRLVDRTIRDAWRTNQDK